MSESQQMEHLGSAQQIEIPPSPSGDASVLHLAGEIDIACAGELQGALLKALHCGKRIQVKTDSVSGVDVTGLQLLWAARRAAAQVGMDFAVSGETAEAIKSQVAELGMEELGIFA